MPWDLAGIVSTDIRVIYGSGQIEQVIANYPLFNIIAVPYMHAEWIGGANQQIDFGVVAPGTPVTESIAISNRGTSILTVDSIVPSHADTTISGAALPLMIPVGGSANVDVTINTSGMNESILRQIEVHSPNAHEAPPGRGATQTLLIRGTVTTVSAAEYVKLFEIPEPDSDEFTGCVAAGDTDNDGAREIIATLSGYFNPSQPPFIHPEVIIYEQIGDDQYVERWRTGTYFEGEIWDDGKLLWVDDVNNDGKDDIIFATHERDGYGHDQLVMIESTSDNAWAVTWTGFIDTGSVRELTIGDSDNDGKKEIVFVARNLDTSNYSSRIFVWENNGGTSFSQIEVIGPITEPDGDPYRSLGGLSIADSDSDGRSEIVFTSGNRVHEWSTNDDQLFIYESTGNDSYTQRFSGLGYHTDDSIDPWGHATTAVADVDQDGHREIVLCNDQDELWVIESPADNTWQWQPPEWKIDIPSDGNCLAVGDIDVDGATEILVGLNARPYLLIYEAFGIGSYVEEWRNVDTLPFDSIHTLQIDATNGSGNPSVICGMRESIPVLGLYAPKDLSITSAGIALDVQSPTEGTNVNISATVWNLESGNAGNVCVRFHDGDPTSKSAQIGTDQSISLIEGGQSGVAQVTWVPDTQGSHDIFVSVDPADAILETDETNNLAAKTVTVTDDDTAPPVISNVSIAEHNGDGDGYVEDDEEVIVSWSLSDQSGIGSTTCSIDAGGVAVTGSYQAVSGPHGIGTHSVVIAATDADNSPSTMSPWTGSFQAYAHAPVVVSVSPTHGSIDVERNVVLDAIFANELLASSVASGAFELRGPDSSLVGGVLTYSSSQKMLRFTPNGLLEYASQYTATLKSDSAGVTDEIGNHLDGDYVWLFTTLADTVDPVAAISDPVQDDVVYGQVAVWGTASDDNLDNYVVEYGAGASPSSWTPITTSTSAVQFGQLCTWDVNTLHGVYSLRVRAEDKAGRTADAVVTVLVDDPPELDPIGDRTVDEGALLDFTVTASDPDGTTPSLSAAALPDGATFTDNGNGTGDFGWTPGYDAAEGFPYNVTFTASDGDLEDSETISLTVNNIPEVGFSQLEYSVGEGDDFVTITVALDEAPATGRTASVDYATSNDEAVSPSDYSATSGTLSFGAGIGTQVFAVQITEDDLLEYDEALNLTLSSPVGCRLSSSNSSAPLTIVDNDVPAISVSPTECQAECIHGQNAPSDSLDVCNSGGGILDYSISDDCDWFCVSPDVGTCNDEHDAIAVDYATSALSPGQYSGTITIGAPGSSNSPQYVQVSLTVKPQVPVNVRASDGTYSERVLVEWDPVPGAKAGIEYQVLRSTVNNLASAQPIPGANAWTSATSYSDYTAQAPTTTTSSGGCGGGSSSTTYHHYCYWVKARALPGGESGVSVSDQGHRGLGKAAATYETVLPRDTDDGLMHNASSDSVLAIRLRSEEAIDPTSVWGVVSCSVFETEAVEWWPVNESDGRDGWVVYRPAEPWQVGDMIMMTAGACTLSGAVVEPVECQFYVNEGSIPKSQSGVAGASLWQPSYTDFDTRTLDLNSESRDLVVLTELGLEREELPPTTCRRHRPRLHDWPRSSVRHSSARVASHARRIHGKRCPNPLLQGQWRGRRVVQRRECGRLACT